MKTGRSIGLLLLILGLVAGSGMPVQAQDDDFQPDPSPVRLLFKFNPLSAMVLTGNFSTEYALNDYLSAEAGFLIGGLPQTVAPEDNPLRWRGYTLGIRLYPRREGLNGYFFAPYLRLRTLTVVYTGAAYDPDVQANRTSEIRERVVDFGGGAVLGRQWVFNESWSLELFIGPQFSRSNNRPRISCEECDGDEQVAENNLPREIGGLGVRAGLTLGFPLLVD